MPPFEYIPTQSPTISEELALSGNRMEMDDDLAILQQASRELSNSQEIVLIVFQIISAILSLIGSCTIVFKIVKGMVGKQKTTPYDRIILGLSSTDIFGNITYIIAPFLLPKETSLRVSAMGNNTTCSFLGFMMQFASAGAMWYSCILSYYYLLTVRYQVRRNVFVKKYERWMHLSALFFPITGFIGFYFGLFAEQDLTMICWNADPIVGYIFGAITTVFTFLSVTINNIVISRYVRKTLLSTPIRVQSRSRHGGDTEHIEEEEVSEEFVGLTSVQKRLKREAATQGFLYVTTFLITWTPVFVLQVLGGSFGYTKDDQGTLYPLLIVNAILWPLQGFFNVFIYVRPTYTRFQIANPEEPTLNLLKKALFDPNIPKMASSSIADSENHRSSNHFKKNIPPRRRSKSGHNFMSSLELVAEEVAGDISESFRKKEGMIKKTEVGSTDLNFLAGDEEDQVVIEAFQQEVNDDLEVENLPKKNSRRLSFSLKEKVDVEKIHVADEEISESNTRRLSID